MADVALVGQCVYYNRLNRRTRAAAQLREEVAEAYERSPLLRRNSYRAADLEDPLTKHLATEIVTRASMSPWLRNTLSLLAVYAIGGVSWFISFKAGAWDVADPVQKMPDESDGMWELVGSVMGYVSAVCYLWYGSTS